MKNVPLSAEWKDHKLNDDWKDFRECHVKGDLLLLYQIRKKPYCEVAVFSKIGQLPF